MLATTLHPLNSRTAALLYSQLHRRGHTPKLMHTGQTTNENISKIWANINCQSYSIIGLFEYLIRGSKGCHTKGRN